MDTENTERCQNYWWGKLEPCRWALQCRTISRPVAGLKKRSIAAIAGKCTSYFPVAVVKHNQKYLVEEGRVCEGREGRAAGHPAELRDQVFSHTQSREWLTSETAYHRSQPMHKHKLPKQYHLLGTQGSNVQVRGGGVSLLQTTTSLWKNRNPFFMLLTGL